MRYLSSGSQPWAHATGAAAASAAAPSNTGSHRFIALPSRSFQDVERRPPQLHDVHAGVGAVHGVAVAAVVAVQVVGLDRALAGVDAVVRHATLVRLARNGRDVIRDLLGGPRVTDVDRADAGVEVREPEH